MSMRGVARRWTLAFAVSALLCGCATQVHRVALDPARLVAQPQAKLQCPYRLGEVIDARPSTGRAGGLGKHLFLVEDAAALVRGKLEGIGVSAAAPAGDQVDVRLVHLYLTQNTITKVPVLVLGVTVAGEPAFLLRSQKASMNWNGTEEEAYASFSRMFDDAMAQLVGKLNARCAVAG
ncbi:MAG TPA: hypothetical protein VIT22_00365 [Pseudoxanthomonas sp.]